MGNVEGYLCLETWEQSLSSALSIVSLLQLELVPAEDFSIVTHYSVDDFSMIVYHTITCTRL